ncbi:MAG: hypothetical protein EBT75_09910 [Proteobacteria bacterium]|nr:hypothetical protein [Pseudomonadota bacterium]NBS07438.1 hypothetical protein [Verrucomicrobiota bacterium]NBS79965.1 hypothetical protein [bacterium]
MGCGNGGRARAQNLNLTVHHNRHARIRGAVGDLQSLGRARPCGKRGIAISFGRKRPEEDLLCSLRRGSSGHADSTVRAARIHRGHLHLKIPPHLFGGDRVAGRDRPSSSSIGPGPGRRAGNPPLVGVGQGGSCRCPATAGGRQGDVHLVGSGDHGQHAVGGRERQHHRSWQRRCRGSPVSVGGGHGHPEKKSNIVGGNGVAGRGVARSDCTRPRSTGDG